MTKANLRSARIGSLQAAMLFESGNLAKLPVCVHRVSRMRNLFRQFVFFSVLVWVVGIAAQGAWAALPEYRPALLGHHPRSLVNLINTQSLMKRGQGDAVTMFSCGVNSLGFAGGARCYRSSPNSDLLQREVMARIDQAQFEPAIYKGAKVGVYLCGTGNFFVRDGKPHLRIFLNQDEEDLKSGKDFVAPQFAFAPGNTDFKGIFYPPGSPGAPGVASLQLEVDLNGQVQGARVVYEYPPGRGYDAYSAGPIRKATFIPGFRNGKRVACRFTWSVIFTGPGWRMKTG